jgi:hypothetical protein
MTTSDWALIISLFSLIIAMASFVWNVWSKFIFPKPRVAVSLMVMSVVGSSPKQSYLTLIATNFGPGEVVIECAIARPKKPWYRRRISLGILNPIDDLRYPDRPTGPFGGGLPKKLPVGESFTLYFPYIADVFLREPLEAIGVHDSFRKAHWAPRQDFLNALERHQRDFADSPD